MPEIIHVDMDAFYASVEKSDKPFLRDKPVIVGGLGPRGVVATASYEARKYGVKSAMPMAKARKLCPQAVYISPRFNRYKQVSQQIRKIFLSYTPLVEFISLDEAFLDVKGVRAKFGSGVRIGKEVKGRIRDITGLTCSVGVAPNKFLAKLASDMQKPDGFTVITKDRIDEILTGLPVSRIRGVGRVTEEKLNEMGIYTIGQLKEIPLVKLTQKFGKHGQDLYNLARGIDPSRVQPLHKMKSISQETTFPRDIYDGREAKRVLSRLSKQVGQRLKQKGVKATTVKIKVRFADFTTVTRQSTFNYSSNSTQAIREVALNLFEQKVESQRRGIRLLGVGVANLSGPKQKQLLLFDK